MGMQGPPGSAAEREQAAWQWTPWAWGLAPAQPWGGGGQGPRVPAGAGGLVELEQRLIHLQVLHQGPQLTAPLLTLLHLQLQVILRVPLSQELACDVLAVPAGRSRCGPARQGPQNCPSQWSGMRSEAAGH